MGYERLHDTDPTRRPSDARLHVRRRGGQRAAERPGAGREGQARHRPDPDRADKAAPQVNVPADDEDSWCGSTPPRRSSPAWRSPPAARRGSPPSCWPASLVPDHAAPATAFWEEKDPRRSGQAADPLLQERLDARRPAASPPSTPRASPASPGGPSTRPATARREAKHLRREAKRAGQAGRQGAAALSPSRGRYARCAMNDPRPRPTSGRPRARRAGATPRVPLPGSQVADQPRAGAGRARRRPHRRTPGAALARHRADGGRADRARRPASTPPATTGRSRPGALRGGADGRLRAGRHRDALRAAGGRARRRRRSPSTATRTRAPRPMRRGARRRCAALGVDVDDEGRGALPFTVARHRRGAAAARSSIDASASSQFVSALLLAGARYDEGVDVRHDGKPVPVAAPHRDDRRACCASTASRSTTPSRTAGGSRPGRSAPSTYAIEPDLSNAAPFLALAAGHRRRGHRPGLAARAPPRPATRCARSSPGWAATVDARRRRA